MGIIMFMPLFMPPPGMFMDIPMDMGMDIGIDVDIWGMLDTPMPTICCCWCCWRPFMTLPTAAPAGAAAAAGAGCTSSCCRVPSGAVKVT
jgi:hypothetical protein